MAREWSNALFGGLLSCFSGTWVDHPQDMWAAEHKLFQLEAAKSVGMYVPATVVTACREQMADFADKERDGVIIKVLKGIPEAQTSTVLVKAEELRDEGHQVHCPVLCQQFIPGTTHLRVLAFGHELIVGAMTSRAVDSRDGTGGDWREYEAGPVLIEQVRALLDVLRLNMGVLDFKIRAADGEPVFLEVNPQGQFLFMEPLLKVPITSRFARYLGALAGQEPG